MIVGLDEVGRGPWAGPLVFGAVVLGGVNIEGLTDSKKLSKKRRETLDAEIREKAASFGLGWVDANELDEVGMVKACELACRRALEQITIPYNEIIIDGTVNFLKDTGKGPFVTTIKQADLLVPSVSAASILAKVARDKFMLEQDTLYPGYGFGSHVGYGTKQHMEALKLYGVTPLHRKSFAPVAALLGAHGRGIDTSNSAQTITTRAIGDTSESVAANYLLAQGYEIYERNWKTKMCEIDIVAEKDNTWYFVEVKHRKTNQQGGGLGAITSKKLAQMQFAATVYCHYKNIKDSTIKLVVITTEGEVTRLADFMILE